MFNVLVIGTSERKNIKLIYEVVEKLLEYHFTFVGEFDNYRYLNNLSIVNKLSEEEIIQCYKKADLFLFPSLSEGFGLPIIEAQFFGVPVITSNREPMKTVAGWGGAFLVNPNSISEICFAIKHVCNDFELKKSLIEKGKLNIEKYKIQNIISKYNDIYNLIMKNVI